MQLVEVLGFSSREKKRGKIYKLDIWDEQSGYFGHTLLLNTAAYHSYSTACSVLCSSSHPLSAGELLQGKFHTVLFVRVCTASLDPDASDHCVPLFYSTLSAADLWNRPFERLCSRCCPLGHPDPSLLLGVLLSLAMAPLHAVRHSQQLTKSHRACQSSFHASPELLYLESISNSLKEAVRVNVTHGTFGRAISFPFKGWCLSPFPFLCPWQNTHTRTMSCPQNTWLQFMSPHSFLYAKYPIHLNRRIIGVGGSLAQTIAVIKPSVHEWFVGSARHIKDGRCCSCLRAIYTRGVTLQTLLALVCL